MMKKISILIATMVLPLYIWAQHAKGLVFDDNAYRNIPHVKLLSKGSYKLPSKVSLKDYCPTPQHQGQMGTCAGWATAYSARTISYAVANGIKGRKVDKYAFSPNYVYSQIKKTDDIDCKKGACLTDAFEIMKKSGVAQMSDLPYNCTSPIGDTLKQIAEAYKIQGYHTLFELKSQDSIKSIVIKRALADKHPVVIAFNTPPSFDKASEL